MRLVFFFIPLVKKKKIEKVVFWEVTGTLFFHRQMCPSNVGSLKPEREKNTPLLLLITMGRFYGWLVALFA